MVFDNDDDDHGGCLLSWCDQRLRHHYPSLHGGYLWALADDDHNRRMSGGDDDVGYGIYWYIGDFEERRVVMMMIA